MLKEIGFKTILISFASLCLGNSVSLGKTMAQMYGSFPNSQDRDLYEDNGSGGNSRGSILDATNPMELMNRLRRATAMDDATTPSDAVDQALDALELEVSSPSGMP